MHSKKLWINLIFAAVLVVAAGILFWINSTRSAGGVAELTYGTSGEVMEISLNKNAQYDIDTGSYTIHLKVEDGRIAFVDSPCPDHKCEAFGWLSREDDWAACLPANATLIVLSEN